jgi:Glycosyl hydrolases family 39
MNKFRDFSILLSLLMIIACGGGGSSTPTPTPDPTPTPTPTQKVSIAVSATKAGTLNLAMSTSFQPAEWDYQFFTNHPTATGPLDSLNAAHVRIQAVSQGIPQTSASNWDFTKLDAILQPVLGVDDHSPEFQVAYAPGFMYYANTPLFVDGTSFGLFGDYSANLVKYYNGIGIPNPNGGAALMSPSPYHIKYWGIYNEPNLNGFSKGFSNSTPAPPYTPSDYVTLYNTVVPKMQAVDPTLKFVAVELSDFGTWEDDFLTPFVSGVTAQVDVMATHFYSTCNQSDTDQTLFNTVPAFAAGVKNIYSILQKNPNLTNVPVWITENNVNADFNNGSGNSTCNPSQKFVTDARGSSAFFAAWRPYLFSQVGQARAEALYHWDFAADAQYGELDDQTGNYRLSYWVDKALQQYFPSSTAGVDVLQTTNSDNTNVEALAVHNADGSVVVMIANHAVNSIADNNGTGSPRNITVDVSALGNFSSASQLTVDANTSLVNGPTAQVITFAPQMTLALNGYGVVFLKLQ